MRTQIDLDIAPSPDEVRVTSSDPLVVFLAHDPDTTVVARFDETAWRALIAAVIDHGGWPVAALRDLLEDE